VVVSDTIIPLPILSKWSRQSCNANDEMLRRTASESCARTIEGAARNADAPQNKVRLVIWFDLNLPMPCFQLVGSSI
jgi:hypothetical protein